MVRVRITYDSNDRLLPTDIPLFITLTDGRNIYVFDEIKTYRDLEIMSRIIYLLKLKPMPTLIRNELERQIYLMLRNNCVPITTNRCLDIRTRRVMQIKYGYKQPKLVAVSKLPVTKASVRYHCYDSYSANLCPVFRKAYWILTGESYDTH